MPLVRIDVPAATSTADRRAAADVVHEALVATFNVPLAAGASHAAGIKVAICSSCSVVARASIAKGARSRRRRRCTNASRASCRNAADSQPMT